MKIVLTDKPLQKEILPTEVQVQTVSYASLDRYAHNVDVVAIVGSRAMAIRSAELEFPSLKLFQLTSAGLDGVPLETYAQRGVAVANAGSVYSVPIAETVVFGMLSMAKKLRKNPNCRHFKLLRRYTEITELNDKCVLILGAGNIGTAVAERLAGFGMKIDGYDPYCADKPQYARILRSREQLMEAIGKYDYVISTLPDSEQTRDFVDAALLAEMKRTAILINVGRKSVFCEKALYDALKNKRIGGAVLDMFEKFPNPLTNRFRRLPNVMVLPGVAAISREVNGRLCRLMTENVAAAVAGTPISYVVNEVR